MFIEALSRGFFAIDVFDYLVLWSVNFVRVNARKLAGRKPGRKNSIAQPAGNTGSGLKIYFWN